MSYVTILKLGRQFPAGVWTRCAAALTKEYFLLESRRSSRYHGQRQTKAQIDAEREG